MKFTHTQKKKVTFCTLLLSASISSAYADSIGNKAGYFTNTITNTVEATITNTGQCGTSNSASTPGQCTNKIINALNAASAVSGVVVIKKGTYTLNRIVMPSNVRLEIEPDTILKMNQNILFDFGKSGGNGAKAENIEITTTGAKTNATRNDRFIIDVNTNTIFQDKRMVRVGYAENFSISRLHQKDNFSQTPNIFLVADDNGQPGVKTDAGGTNINRNVVFNSSYARIPKKGYLADISGEKIATGYAVIQPFSGEDLYFKNISGERGITVRIEPGSGLVTDRLNRAGPRIGAYRNIILEDISNTGGFAAIFLKPHTKINENIEIKGTTEGKNSTFVIWADSGSAPVWADTDDIGFTRGYFTDTKIGGTVKHIVSNKNFKSDITKAGSYFLPREGIRDTASNGSNGNFQLFKLPRDGSGARWLGQPIAPIAVVSSYSQSDVGNDLVKRYDNPLLTVDGDIEAPAQASGQDLDEGSNNTLRKRYRKFGGRYNIKINAAIQADATLDYSLLGLNAGDITRNRSTIYRENAIDGTNQNGGSIKSATDFITK
ncbi:hypothetical protein I6F40_10745 [Pseudoalteromonas sp. SWXJ133]|uniref:hypothetical protein n=1 Tax=unclassified Pseudoalteromonas TaxID=194690 RepID=UPI0004168B47|nr:MULTISPECIES: hypothetical protein [unclassified Pseudoalteromonas]MBH0020822.1 hypothetical protein [Pseudoalteromonas sp. SWXJ133]MBH0074492.1 hypothetical protein [Pseudoalteromonas sp. SWYJ118]